MRILVTGVTGFAGSHLVDLLLDQGHDVYGLVHLETSHQPLPEHDRFHAEAGNILLKGDVERAFARAKPERVFHLAGQAAPGVSWSDPAFTMAINTGGTANLLEAARLNGAPKTVVITSAEIYPRPTEDSLPITEESQPDPRHPYGVSKLAAAQLCRLYWKRYSLQVVEARPFNHIGPRQAKGFVVPDIASQLAEIKLGLRPSRLLVGNLSAERDFTDVRDVVRAYSMLADEGRSGESYLICSGHPVSISTILDLLVEASGQEVEIEFDAQRSRPSDTPIMYGDYSKIREHVGWAPSITLRQSLADALADWIDKISLAARDRGQ